MLNGAVNETIESSLQIFNLYTIKINLKKLVKINSTTGIYIRLRKICRCLHELIKCSLLMIPPNDSWRNKTYKINDVNTEQQFGYFQNDDIYKNNEIVLNNSGTGNNKKITGSLRLLPYEQQLDEGGWVERTADYVLSSDKINETSRVARQTVPCGVNEEQGICSESRGYGFPSGYFSPTQFFLISLENAGILSRPATFYFEHYRYRVN